MSKYFVTANYTSSAMKGMIENPHNREEAIKGLLEKMNITLDCFYVSATGHIFMVIAGSNVDVGAMALVVGSQRIFFIGSERGVQKLISQELLIV